MIQCCDRSESPELDVVRGEAEDGTELRGTEAAAVTPRDAFVHRVAKTLHTKFGLANKVFK